MQHFHFVAKSIANANAVESKTLIALDFLGCATEFQIAYCSTSKEKLYSFWTHHYILSEKLVVLASYFPGCPLDKPRLQVAKEMQLEIQLLNVLVISMIREFENCQPQSSKTLFFPDYPLGYVLELFDH